MGVCKYWAEGSQRLFTLEFDRLRKSMGVIIKEQGSDTGNKLLVKVPFSDYKLYLHFVGLGCYICAD